MMTSCEQCQQPHSRRSPICGDCAVVRNRTNARDTKRRKAALKREIEGHCFEWLAGRVDLADVRTPLDERRAA